jgi:hypothetical protein
LVRYRIGDMVKITSLRNEKLGINIPQMAFERRVDDVIDFVFVRLTEKAIWQAIEKSGVPYNDWIAFKNVENSELRILLEPQNGNSIKESDLSQELYHELTKPDEKAKTLIPGEYANMIDFKVSVSYLPRGAFDNYTAQRQAQGADLAHLKPPHINPSAGIMTLLLGENEETIVVKKAGGKAKTRSDSGKITLKT